MKRNDKKRILIKSLLQIKIMENLETFYMYEDQTYVHILNRHICT